MHRVPQRFVINEFLYGLVLFANYAFLLSLEKERERYHALFGRYLSKMCILLLAQAWTGLTIQQKEAKAFVVFNLPHPK